MIEVQVLDIVVIGVDIVLDCTVVLNASACFVAAHIADQFGVQVLLNLPIGGEPVSAKVTRDRLVPISLSVFRMKGVFPDPTGVTDDQLLMSPFAKEQPR